MENINFADAIILLIILLGGVVGFKEGAIKKLTSIIGLILVVVLAFTFKDKLSIILYENLPFFRFGGIQSLNIVIYELIAFLVIAALLFIVYRILLTVTGIIEKVLKATVILSIPSKILGFVIGLIENYLWLVVILFVLNSLTINMDNIGVRDSKMVDMLMKNTPIVSKYTSPLMDAYSDISKVVSDKNTKSATKTNEEVLNILLKYNVVSVDSLDKILDMNKVDVNDKSFIDKYR